MPTLTVRNVPDRVVNEIKSRAKRHGRSMEQEVGTMLETQHPDRKTVLDQIREGWAQQTRRPTPEEIDAWIGEGRE